LKNIVFQFCGVSGSGKTTFTKRLLGNHAYFGGPLDGDIMYCFGTQNDQMSEILDICPQIKFHEGVLKGWDNAREIFNPRKRNLLIIDDLGDITQNSDAFTRLLTKGSHHANVAVLRDCVYILHDDRDDCFTGSVDCFDHI